MLSNLPRMDLNPVQISFYLDAVDHVVSIYSSFMLRNLLFCNFLLKVLVKSVLCWTNQYGGLQYSLNETKCNITTFVSLRNAQKFLKENI